MENMYSLILKYNIAVLHKYNDDPVFQKCILVQSYAYSAIKERHCVWYKIIYLKPASSRQLHRGALLYDNYKAFWNYLFYRLKFSPHQLWMQMKAHSFKLNILNWGDRDLCACLFSSTQNPIIVFLQNAYAINRVSLCANTIMKHQKCMGVRFCLTISSSIMQVLFSKMHQH